MKYALLAVLTIVSFSACGQQTKEAYSFDIQGCKTAHELDSVQALCDTLRDPEKNRYQGQECARQQRYEMFQQRCSGQKWDK